MSVMMKCGCAAQGVCSSKGGVKFDPPIPSCIVHDCLEVAKTQPDLTGRTAQCTYRSCRQYLAKYRDTHYGELRSDGRSYAPSSFDLPFFVYRGPGSDAATQYCTCGSSIIAHYPTWHASIKVVRRWYKIEKHEDVIGEHLGCPDEESARVWAETEADFFRKQKRHHDTEVFSADVVDLRKGPPAKNHIFVAHGPYENDEYFCGCMGWD